MIHSAENLYRLLPAVYRLRDAEQGFPLKALAEILAEQALRIEEDIDRLYDNSFVETCEEWVVPYIGALLGVQGLHAAGEGGLSHRARVANTLGYRRRKGTASMLEQLARDTTGWPARCVELFRLLGTTQNVHHPRLGNVRTPDLRNGGSLDLLDTPFDSVAHTADIRPIAAARHVRHNIMNAAIFLWRLAAVPIADAPAFPHGDGRFSFDQLGSDLPLFHSPLPEASPDAAAGEVHVPAPIRRRSLRDSLREDHARYYGTEASLLVRVRGVPVPRSDMVACSLEGWTRRPPAGRVAVDPVLGRLAFPENSAVLPEDVRVDYHYGAAAPIGGGCYARHIEGDPRLKRYRVGKSGAGAATIAAAVQAWVSDGRPNGVIEVSGNEVYRESLELRIPADGALVLRAADQTRPVLHLSAPFVMGGLQARNEGEPGGRLTIEGLVIAGHRLEVAAGDLLSLEFLHCTLLPGWDPGAGAGSPGRESVRAAGNPRLTVTVFRSVTGALRLEKAARTVIRDSIVDAGEGAAVAAEAFDASAATVFGSVEAERFGLCSNSIFTGTLKAARSQEGCLRFCFVPVGSRGPRQYRCQPELAAEQAVEAALRADPRLSGAARRRIREVVYGRVLPAFTDPRFGRPAFGQLGSTCPVEIAAGADDQGEMGALHFLRQPQREANLASSLAEYLPVGLEAGVFHVT